MSPILHATMTVSVLDEPWRDFDYVISRTLAEGGLLERWRTRFTTRARVFGPRFGLVPVALSAASKGASRSRALFQDEPSLSISLRARASEGTTRAGFVSFTFLPGPRLLQTTVRTEPSAFELVVDLATALVRDYSAVWGGAWFGQVLPPGTDLIFEQIILGGFSPVVLPQCPLVILGAANAARIAADPAVPAIYERLVSRRHDPAGNEELRKKLRDRPLIEVDLHMHTDHSSDCATPVKVLIETARDRGFGAIAITDHNEVSGAMEAAEVAAEMDDFKIIVAEEVMTGDAGEVIGLFLKEKIPRGMTLAETVAEIKRQGGLVYVPHPFDRMHAVPDYEHLLGIIEDVDAIEVFNPRVAFSAFNEEAARFAAKYRIPAGAGSDAHVAQGLGTARVRMRDFDGPQEFLESLRGGEVLTLPTNYVYVQALKFLQTKATPEGARRSVNRRRVRRATRKA